VSDQHTDEFITLMSNVHKNLSRKIGLQLGEVVIKGGTIVASNAIPQKRLSIIISEGKAGLIKCRHLFNLKPKQKKVFCLVMQLKKIPKRKNHFS
jgi:hypothetical protein